jgi:hypothetical protein
MIKGPAEFRLVGAGVSLGGREVSVAANGMGFSLGSGDCRAKVTVGVFSTAGVPVREKKTHDNVKSNTSGKTITLRYLCMINLLLIPANGP